MKIINIDELVEIDFTADTIRVSCDDNIYTADQTIIALDSNEIYCIPRIQLSASSKLIVYLRDELTDELHLIEDAIIFLTNTILRVIFLTIPYKVNNTYEMTIKENTDPLNEKLVYRGKVLYSDKTKEEIQNNTQAEITPANKIKY